MRTPGEATEGMEKIAMHGSIQKSVMNAMVKKMAMGDSNQRTTNTVQLSHFSRVDRCGSGCSRVPS